MCDVGYYGVNCGYYCDFLIMCFGYGWCVVFGGCDCDFGYVGYWCEYYCNVICDCYGNG